MINSLKNKITHFIKIFKREQLIRSVNKLVEVVNLVDTYNSKPVVLCLLKNGSYFIPSFIAHYKSIGFTNFVFLDNNSDDNSIELLKSYNVTILKTTLPYKKFKWAFKQFLVHHYGRKIWSLYVDIDELWDYPCSDKLPLNKFFKYLNSKKFTAVQSHMLDMFSNEPLHNLKQFEKKALKESYEFYDNSGLIEKKYTKAYNTISNKKTRHYWGGVHNSIFGIENIYISKIPLIKWDESIFVHESSHTSTHIHIADISTVLLHYKFVLGFYEKAEKIIKDESYWNAGETYKKYLKVIQNNNDLSLFTSNSKKYKNSQQLVNEGFLMDSETYITFVKNNR